MNGEREKSAKSIQRIAKFNRVHIETEVIENWLKNIHSTVTVDIANQQSQLTKMGQKFKGERKSSYILYSNFDRGIISYFRFVYPLLHSTADCTPHVCNVCRWDGILWDQVCLKVVEHEHISDNYHDVRIRVYNHNRMYGCPDLCKLTMVHCHHLTIISGWTH